MHRLSLFLNGFSHQTCGGVAGDGGLVYVSAAFLVYMLQKNEKSEKFLLNFQEHVKTNFPPPATTNNFSIASKREWGVCIVKNYYCCKKPFPLHRTDCVNYDKLITITSNNLSSCMFSTCKYYNTPF